MCVCLKSSPIPSVCALISTKARKPHLATTPHDAPTAPHHSSHI